MNIPKLTSTYVLMGVLFLALLCIAVARTISERKERPVVAEPNSLTSTHIERFTYPARHALTMFAHNCLPDKKLVFGYSSEQFTASCASIEK